jgi:2-(1,2-epoxy-1,2-dihydrophenyl)acetyl-CoA isomerase
MADRILDSGTDVVKLEVRDRIGVITLNRPDRRNALHADMYAPVKAALEQWAGAEDVGCIVLTGAGKGFCAGGDVKGGRRRQEDGAPTIEESTAQLLDDVQFARLLHESPKLTLAAVNGAAAGAGMALALACDLRVMTASAKFVPGWIRLAFAGDFGGPWFLTRLVGPSKALEILVGNMTLTAEDALTLGLANRVVADEQFQEVWRSWAAEFARAPQEAVALVKANVRQALTDPLSSYLPAETERQVLSGTTADHRTAVRAWLEKSEPDFTRR